MALIWAEHRAPSTVSRELARHTFDPIKGYDAGLAGYRAHLTRHRSRQRLKLHPDGEIFEVVVYLLRKYWSPEQIVVNPWFLHTLRR